MYGTGDILKVDLTEGKISRYPIPQDWIDRFLGGEGINTWILWEHFLRVDPEIDPRSPDNILIVSLGPLGGLPTGLGAKTKFTFKSPLTNMYGDSVSGGNFGSQLRWAGYDHLVITGRAPKPVYLWIEDDRVEIRDAGHLWGKGAEETVKWLWEELGDEEIGIACIGQGGENLVAYASITNTPERSAGRMGAGCVAGSKNLKAMAARGTQGVRCHDPAGFIQAVKEILQAMDKDHAIWGFKESGTIGIVEFAHQIYMNQYRNLQDCKVPDEKIVKMDSSWYHRHLKIRDFACSPGCTVACSSWGEVKGDETPFAKRFSGQKGQKPEYWSVANFGMGADIPDYPAINHLHYKCNDYGLDLGDAGSIICLLMELWQRGHINQKMTEKWLGKPMTFEWGNFEGADLVLDSIALQNNELGKMFRDGIVPGARELERITEAPALKFAAYGKGGATIDGQEVRSFPSWAVMLAVGSTGCHHSKGAQFVDMGQREDVSMKWFGRPEAGKAYSLELKGALVAYAENFTAAVHLLGFCLFMPMFDPLIYNLGIFAKAYQALTGIEMTEEKLYRIGERVYNLEKAFNSRLGLSRKDDMLCERIMKEPCPQGPGKGMKAEDYLNQLLDEYYAYHGWDPKTSLQTKKKLEQLGLEDIANILEKEGKLSLK